MRSRLICARAVWAKAWTIDELHAQLEQGANIDALQLKRENDGLRTTILCLRREIENKQGHVQRLAPSFQTLQQRLRLIACCMWRPETR